MRADRAMTDAGIDRFLAKRAPGRFGSTASAAVRALHLVDPLADRLVRGLPEGRPAAREGGLVRALVQHRLRVAEGAEPFPSAIASHSAGPHASERQRLVKQLATHVVD